MNKAIKLRSPNSVRPWQHVIEPIYGYLLLAQKQYQKKIITPNHAWNFGPKKASLVTVKQVISKFKNQKIINRCLIKKNRNIETKILKLNSSKAIKYLKWKQKWNIDQTLKKIIEWNTSTRKEKNFRKMCENQITEYLKD